MLDNSDELHVLHPSSQPTPLSSSDTPWAETSRKSSSAPSPSGDGKSLKDYTLRLLMHKPDVQFVSHSLVELGLGTADQKSS